MQGFKAANPRDGAVGGVQKKSQEKDLQNVSNDVPSLFTVCAGGPILLLLKSCGHVRRLRHDFIMLLRILSPVSLSPTGQSHNDKARRP